MNDSSSHLQGCWQAQSRWAVTLPQEFGAKPARDLSFARCASGCRNPLTRVGFALKRVQKRNHLAALRATQRSEGIARGCCLAVVPEDGVLERLGAAVVQQALLENDADAPKRRGAHFSDRGNAIVADAVAECAHVMQQEIREWVIGLVIERRDGTRAGSEVA